MALFPPLIQAALLANRACAPNPFNGVAYTNLAAGVAQAVSQWAVGQPYNLALTGASVGSAGAGTIATVLSKIIVPPTVDPMRIALAGAGLNGPLGESLAISMALGIAEAFSLYAQYTGTSVGVGVGSDTSKITVANAPALIGILEEALPGAGLSGPALHQMTVGLGNGISALLLLGGGTAAVAGVPTVPTAPAVGSTNSVMV